MRNITLSIITIIALGGCAIGPDYVKPIFETPKELRHQDADSTNIKLQDRWWESLGDLELNSYIDEVLKNNLDRKIVDTQIGYLLAQFDLSNSYLYPQLSANGSYNRQRQNVPTTTTSSTYAANLAVASYEIDIWGKVRRASEAARAKLLSGEESRRALNISLITNAILLHAKLLAAIEEEKIAKESLEYMVERSTLSKTMHSLGAMSDSELNDVLSAEMGAKNSFLSFQKKLIDTQNQYDLLLGKIKNPNKPHDGASIYSLNIVPPKGISSDILSERPDIAIAEQELIAANAQIGIAKAAYFPSISLTGIFGFQSSEMDKLFDTQTRAWQFIPAVNLPIFTAGKISANVESAKFAEHQALLNYEKTIITAFSEVDSALFAYKSSKQSEENIAKNEKLMSENLRIAELKYKLGAISKPAMLGARISFLAAKSALVEAKIVTATASLGVVKSVGGSWSHKLK